MGFAAQYGSDPSVSNKRASVRITPVKKSLAKFGLGLAARADATEAELAAGSLEHERERAALSAQHFEERAAVAAQHFEELEAVKQELDFDADQADSALCTQGCALHSFITFPSAEMVRARMPPGFVQPLKGRAPIESVRIVLDCCELPCETPTDPNEAQLYYSEYKKGHTIKFLVGVTPDGTVVFVSEGFPGGFTDLELVQKIGILDLLSAGDCIMADRAFQMWEETEKRGMFLIMPTVSHSLASSSMQYASWTEEESRYTFNVAHGRIHVERAMLAIMGGWGWTTVLLKQKQKHLFSDLFRVTAYFSTFRPPLQGLDLSGEM
mmetsp:Transcript_17097/g.43808  ORF Transcript_17097/g.43808 Transcript_17097/m.43808 type:complete len:324 (-) Transcript_17097:29-1000(-)